MDDAAARARALIAIGSETRNLDLKGPMPWPARTTKERYEIVRDILAFTNTPDGGAILVGVERTTHAVEGLSATDVTTWDTTKVGQGCAVFGSPHPVVTVSYPEVDRKQLVMIEVAPFPEIPTVCRQEARLGADVILRQGGLYIRTLMAQTVEIHDEEQVRALIEQAINRKSDHLLAQIRALVGPPPPSVELPHPYDALIAQDLTELRDRVR